MPNWKRYYRVSKQEGYGFLEASLRLPYAFYKKINHKDGAAGRGLFHLPLLASYPRSGTNWTRYFIESISGKPTPGEEKLIAHNSAFTIDRAHAAFRTMNRYPSVVLLVRHPVECIVRHHGIEKIQGLGVDAFLNDKTDRMPAFWYIENIKAFDKYQGRKLLIYYEDLMTAPDMAFKKIGEFFDFDDDKVDGFLKNIDDHKEKSVGLYSQHFGSETKGSKYALQHHGSKLTKEDKAAFQSYFSGFPEVYSKYLKRYWTD